MEKSLDLSKELKKPRNIRVKAIPTEVGPLRSIAEIGLNTEKSPGVNQTPGKSHQLTMVWNTRRVWWWYLGCPVPLVRYTGPFLKWTKEKFRPMDQERWWQWRRLQKMILTDHSDHSIVEIGRSTRESPVDMRRLAITQNTVKDHQITPVGTHKE